MSVARRWYVIISKLNKDEVLFHQLCSLGYEVFFPRYFVAVNKPGRYQVKAYFPGYMFVKLDPAVESVSALQWMPNSDGLVNFGAKPTSVPDVLVEAIQRHIYKLNQQIGCILDEHHSSDFVDSKQAITESMVKPIFLPDLSGDQRVQSFLKLLEGVSLSQTRREEA